MTISPRQTALSGASRHFFSLDTEKQSPPRLAFVAVFFASGIPDAAALCALWSRPAEPPSIRSRAAALHCTSHNHPPSGSALHGTFSRMHQCHLISLFTLFQTDIG